MALLQPFGDVPPSEGVRVLLIDPLVAYASSVIRVLNSLRRCKLEKGALITPILLLTLFAQLAYSQSAIKAPDMVPPSPKSENFLRFGNYPVNPSTGAPDISIPLYTVRSGKLEVPITLRYHIGNVKPGYDHSDVGFGWVLDVGGQVSRTIYGKPDDVTLKFDSKYNSKSIDQTDPIQYDELVKCYEKEKDSEYDIFNYSFLSQTGKFIIDKNSEGKYQTHLFSYKPISIDFITQAAPNSPSGSSISTVKIKDPNGNSYTFGGDACEKVSGVASLDAVTGWLLTRIVDVNNSDEVNLTYSKAPEYYYCNNNYSHYYINRDDELLISKDPEVAGDPSSASYDCGRDVASCSKYVDMTIRGIAFADGNITFDLSSDNKRINGFSVCDKQNKVIKKIIFYKSDFAGVYGHTRLDSLRIYNSDQSQYMTYKFIYDNNVMGKFGSDYWGYYNGEDEGCVERTYDIQRRMNDHITISPGSISKIPNEMASQAEILKKIIFPTKGETEFCYEGNRYNHLEGYSNTSSTAGGGLRIKKTVARDGNGGEEEKTYNYEDGFVKFLNTDETCYKSTSFEYIKYGFDEVTIDGIRWPHYSIYRVRNRRYNNFPSPELGDNSVRYTKVEELFTSKSGNGGSEGKIVYHYDYSNSNAYSVYNSGFEEARTYLFNIRDWDNGLLWKKEVLKRSPNNNFSPVAIERYSYSHLRENTYSNLKLFQLTDYSYDHTVMLKDQLKVFNDLKSLQGDVYPIFGYYDYHIETGRTHLNQKRTVSYFDRQGVVDSLVTVENYYYDNPAHDLATRTETTTSRGNKVTTFTTYPLDYSSDSPLFVKDMQDNGLVTYPIESISCVTKGTNQYVISGIANQYKTGARGLLDSQWMLSTCTPIALGSFKFSNRPLGVPLSSGSSTAFIPDSRYVRKVSYDSYDSYANLTAYHMEGDSPTEIVWGYKKQRPVAIAKGANGKLNDAVKQALKYVGCNSLDSLTGSVPYVDNILNNPNIWDTFNRKLREMLPHVEVKTFTYLPLIGITSETDSRGKTVKYAYDSFGRLMNVTELGKLVSSYDYKYYNQVASSGSFSSKRYSWTFSKNTCPNGYVGGGVVYTVPEGKYTSTISQADADAKAQVEAKDRGQVYANDNGVCYYLNTNTSSVAIAPNPGLNSTLIITSNTDWSIQGVPDWLSVSITFGSGDATITMTPTVAYDSSQQRRATLTLQATNVSISKTIEVFQ